MDSPPSENGPSRSLLAHGLRFLGQQTARQSHELTNVLNIINELVGLLDDMVRAIATGRNVEPDRFGEVAAKIQRQIQRGQSIISGLNRFAHSVDRLCGTFPVSGLREQVSFLAARSLRLQRAKLEIAEQHRDVTIGGYLLGYQQVVLTALDLALAVGAAQHNLALRFEAQEAVLEIIIEADTPLASTESTRALEQLLQELASALGGSVIHYPASLSDRRIRVMLPKERKAVVRCDTEAAGNRG